MSDAFEQRMAEREAREQAEKKEIEVNTNPQTWDIEMIADYLIWIFSKRPIDDFQKVLEIVDQKLK
jgi:hypothetical protein